jgi:uncharacterized membrane protein
VIEMTSDVNVAEVERWACALGGAALAAYGIKQLKDERPMAGAALAAAGGSLIYRGARGYCPMYAAAGINTAQDDTKATLAGSGGINVEEAVIINRPADELYRFWRRFEDLPKFMQHLESVEWIGGRRTHWVAKAPAGRTVEWDAEIINEIPGELIAWRTLDGADVTSAGSVRFRRVAGGTEVRVRLQYEPPAGKLGATVAWLLGHDPARTIGDDLCRFKELVETGEVPTLSNQARGQWQRNQL